MLVLPLRRFLSDDEGTLGVLYRGPSPICYIDELPWRDNRANRSRIPAGRYQVVYLPRSASGKYRDVYHVRDVPGRSGILIHAGNWSGDVERGWRSDSWGCLLPASRIGRLSNQRAGLASKGALARIHAATGRRDFILEVIDGLA